MNFELKFYSGLRRQMPLYVITKLGMKTLKF